MTLVDTSVLLDVLLDGASHGDESAGRLRDAMKRGAVFVNDVVAAELAPVFPDEADLWATLERANVEHERYAGRPSTSRARRLSAIGAPAEVARESCRTS